MTPRFLAVLLVMRHHFVAATNYTMKIIMKLTVKLSSRVCCVLVVMQLISGNIFAQTSHFTEREIRFRNDSIELAGTFIAPSIDSRYPAIVFLHGSGPATRAGARLYAEEFSKLGIASLIFDKRGSGSSGGSWLTSSLDDLSNDALAAVQFLKTVEHVDSNRIGFWGVSQAGWVATLAASLSADVAFMVLISGGGASPRESELFSYRSAMQKANLSSSEITDAERVIDLYFSYLATGENRAGLVSELEGDRDKPWYKYASLDRILPSEGNRANWSWVATWDPASHIEKVSCPVLLMFGDKDTDHPTEISIKKWRDGLKKAANENVTLVVFPGAGHGIRMREGFTGSGRPPFADGYSELMLGWLWQHVVTTTKK
ncbi:MAG: alpha/beta fold hydrolase [Bacteroidetes bacterium]|nr:MAG: alpha/beta fold hydrolase [Bacteroidota bacterium]